LHNLLDEDTLERIAQSTGSRLWAGFVSFGSASAGVLAIFLITRLLKGVVDVLIRGYALHSIYGWSLHLVGAIWSSIAHLLLHLARTERPNEPPAPVQPAEPPREERPPPSAAKDEAASIELEEINHNDYSG
ncbi:hypothetical protein KM043_000046, partial [Ampulex compressa]